MPTALLRPYGLPSQSTFSTMRPARAGPSMRTGVPSCTLRTPAAGSQPVDIRFAIPFKCHFGQHLAVIGGPRQLGQWEAAAALPMTWQQGDVWAASLAWDDGGTLEYKYVVRNDDLTVAGWKPGPNCELQLPTGSPLRAVRVWDTWDGGCQTVELEVPEAGTSKPALRRPKGSLGVLSKETLVALQRLAGALEAGEAAAAAADPGSPEALRADAELASATQHALAMMRAEEALGRLPRRGKARNGRGRGRGAV
uniref:CBM20 domain-containing protein n=1 Tax=Auxenochlorella protothecoides TaxID=3075 RepID=A0A1D1ZRJ0_AUXPR